MSRIIPFALLAPAAVCALAQQTPPSLTPKPVPRLQAVPLPDHQVSFQLNGRELTRYHYGPALKRPFLYPVNGPSGRSLTRMGHPHDPEGHSHHNSVWIAHNDVGGISFWDDRAPGKIVHRRIRELIDGDAEAALLSECEWVSEGRALLLDSRRIAVQPLPGAGWLLRLDLTLSAREAITLGKTPFGMIGVRMAKSIGVNDGGGLIRNSEGGRNEAEVFWKPARWVDYSGAIQNGRIEGITLLDHPANPDHPGRFHVRNDGWMGASLTLNGPRVVKPDSPLTLRYGLWVHGGLAAAENVERAWRRFVSLR